MSHMNRGLFDPRQKMVHWPEPNDDPNIPYVWGLSGYALGNPQEPEVSVTSQDVPTDAPTKKVNEALKVAAGVAITLGAVGLYDGYTNSTESGAGGRLVDSLSTGLLYATGVGFIVSKVKG